MEYQLPLQQFAKRLNEHPDKPYLVQPRNGGWDTLTWRQVDEQARRIASGLKAKGFQPGDRIAIIAKNSAEWVIADFAIMMADMISVPIYSTAGPETIQYVLEHSGARMLFIGKLDSDAAVKAAAGDILTVSFPYQGITARESWTDWLQNNEPLSEIHEPEATDIATIVYTSGSTGKPKGVVLEYDQLGYQAYHGVQCFPDEILEMENRVLSYLPLAHITERTFISFASLNYSLTIYFNESLETFTGDLKHASPTVFLSVPRLWARFQAGVLAQTPDSKLNFLLKIPFLGKKVAAKIREALGLKDCLVFATGSAPISLETLRWFQKIGVEIAEGWGMTETTAGVCCNMPFNAEYLGTIGKPIHGIDMKLGDNDEIMIRGKAIFKSYYNNPEATEEAFMDGWFKTGDKGELLPNDAWRITGRVKEQFKTAKGKYVSPVPVEGLLAANTNIEQVCVTGYGRKQPVALIVLNEAISGWDKQVHEGLEDTLESVNAKLESHARLDHLIITKDPWSIENNLLTPTLKLKRDKIDEKYRPLVDESYQDRVVWEEKI